MRFSFWHTPRANISGRWVLFTSNWEKTLGTDPGAEAGGAARQDVFLLELKPATNRRAGATSARLDDPDQHDVAASRFRSLF